MSAPLKVVKIGEDYLNFDNITHVEFDTTPNGLTCTVYFNCHISEVDGHNSVQANKPLSGGAARDLKAWLDLRIKTMEPQ